VLVAQLAAAHAELKSQRDFIANYQAQVAGVEEEARAAELTEAQVRESVQKIQDAIAQAAQLAAPYAGGGYGPLPEALVQRQAALQSELVKYSAALAPVAANAADKAARRAQAQSQLAALHARIATNQQRVQAAETQALQFGGALALLMRAIQVSERRVPPRARARARARAPASRRRRMMRAAAAAARDDSGGGARSVPRSLARPVLSLARSLACSLAR
jgi:hypothetical protein